MAEATPTARLVRFGTFAADLRAGELRKNGLKIKLQEQPFQILSMLVTRPGEVVTREEVRQKLWPGDTFVDFDKALNTAVNKIREALSESADNPRFVETLPRRGYRFIAPVEADTGKTAGQEVLPSPQPQTTVAGFFRSKMSMPSWALVPTAVMIGVALWALWPSSEPESHLPMRLSVEVAPGESLYAEQGPAAVLSPDGTRLAFVIIGEGGRRRLYVRPLDRFEATPLAGTEGVRNPFFSPDGEWIAFFAGGKLKKISVAGGAAVTLCDASSSRGGSWGEDGNIIFAPGTRSGLWRVSSAGGIPEAVTTLDKEKQEITHHWPQVLPGADAVLFTVVSEIWNLERANIQIQSLETGEKKTLVQGGFFGRYLPTGHLVYVSVGNLVAVPFDVHRMEVTGPPVPILDDVLWSWLNGTAHFDFSQTGALVYLSGKEFIYQVSILWMDSEGKTEPLLDTPGNYNRPRFSPDGKRLAVQVADGNNPDIWIYDLERQALSRLTFYEGWDQEPVWTPDGRYVTFASVRHGGTTNTNIYWKGADGGGEARRLTESEHVQYPNSWSPDGKTLVFMESGQQTDGDLWTLPMEEDGAGGLKPGKPAPFLITPFDEGHPAFSPDGRWVAYGSNESGRGEVYVRPFPGPGGKWQISTGGGWHPTWSPNGKELFYRTGDNRIMAVTYSVEGDSFRAERPRLWSEGRLIDRRFFPSFALHPDGKRFAVLKKPEGVKDPSITHVNLVTNWFDEVRRRVAAAGKN